MKRHSKRCGGSVAVNTRRIWATEPGGTRAVDMIWIQCACCGAWLQIGPSDEEPVRVEVRAAELAAGFANGPWVGTPREDFGWIIWTNLDLYGSGYDRSPVGDLESAGYLANAIYSHDREQAAGRGTEPAP